MLDNLENLLETVAKGEISPAEALQKLKYLHYESVGEFAKIDHHRTLRTGFPEVIFGLGKTPTQIVQIMRVMESKNPLVMATKISEAVHAEIQRSLPTLRYFPIAQISCLGQSTMKKEGKITILTAGTADLPVAEEAAVTGELCGFMVDRLWDVGVAGIHRLLSHREAIAGAEVIIVVAGMEGALASVVAGLADCPIVAVPTSIGYGASFNGLAPLLTMLNSCATGIGVVNIDNGFGAAMLAGKILQAKPKD
ncbi:MAG: 1-(5-phosphoribosyl)-5-amino-4-imidazole-carboxylate carboxylase [Oscillatoriales cyanobacterium CG2_30_44_21]|nr:MAG: 1-(5-phosphoribosyl)-5-amino-4-imidazole-carboxylate carboxylase [Oscillatoriales cyanobacterium CG2_30_44_21]